VASGVIVLIYRPRDLIMGHT